MKNGIIAFAACAMALTACDQTPLCHIHGTVPSEKWDGQYVFFVPQYAKDSIGVDSTKITGHEFTFETTKKALYDVRLSWRTRYGIQNLLVATEPGLVEISLDSISHGGGAPLNDSLEAWKRRTMAYNETSHALAVAYRNFYAAGDSTMGDAVKAQAKAAYEKYRDETLRLAESVDGTPLEIFLHQIYPARKK